MSKYPKLQFALDLNQPGTAVLTVSHNARQSYSKAVEPAAKKYARKHLPIGHWFLTDVDYGKTGDWGPRMECTTIYIFKTTLGLG